MYVEDLVKSSNEANKKKDSINDTNEEHVEEDDFSVANISWIEEDKEHELISPAIAKKRNNKKSEKLLLQAVVTFAARTLFGGLLLKCSNLETV